MMPMPFSRRWGYGLVAALLIVPGGKSFAAGEVEFRGSGYVQDFSEECAQGGYTEAVYVNVRFRPRGMGMNGRSTRISFFFPQFHASSYELPKGKLGKTFKNVVGGATGSATSFFSNKPRLRIVEMDPADIKKRTDGLLMSGQIQNFDGIEGCEAYFDISLRRQP
jgi:hypothetical protein